MTTEITSPLETEKQQVDAILARFSHTRDIIIPALQAVQEKLGYLSPYALEKTAEVAGISPNTVAGVATFYAQFRYVRPGKHVIRVCEGTACHVCGSHELFEALERELGISDGQTTLDNMFSLLVVRCVGGCALAPVMEIDGIIHGKVVPTRIKEVLAKYQKREETNTDV